MTDETAPDVIAERLRIATGFAESEHEEIAARFGSLGKRLRSFAVDSVDMELSVKDRETNEQRVTLELWVAGMPRLVSTSTRPELSSALTEVRDDMIRLVDDAKTKREPRNNRHLREPLT